MLLDSYQEFSLSFTIVSTSVPFFGHLVVAEVNTWVKRGVRISDGIITNPQYTYFVLDISH